MRRISFLERSLGQFALSQSPSSAHVCRSCRLRATAAATGPQRRQIQSLSQQATLSGRKDISVAARTAGAARSASTQVNASTLPQSPEKDPNYIEATTWENLERVGSDTWVEDQLDPYDSYEGWTKLDSKKQLSKQDVENVLPAIVSEADPSGQVPTGLENWSEYKLSSPALKFKIAKLLQQKEGIKVSDFAMNSVRTLSDLGKVLVHKPEPKKVAQRLQEEESIKELANIKVHARRVTPVDKEKAVGRWKIIEQELLDHGLPATRTQRYRKNNKTQVEV